MHSGIAGRPRRLIFRLVRLDFIANYVIVFVSDAGWSSLAARRAHNPKVTGSNPVPATKFQKPGLVIKFRLLLLDVRRRLPSANRLNAFLPAHCAPIVHDLRL